MCAAALSASASSLRGRNARFSLREKPTAPCAVAPREARRGVPPNPPVLQSRIGQQSGDTDKNKAGLRETRKGEES